MSRRRHIRHALVVAAVTAAVVAATTSVASARTSTPASTSSSEVRGVPLANIRLVVAQGRAAVRTQARPTYDRVVRELTLGEYRDLLEEAACAFAQLEEQGWKSSAAAAKALSGNRLPVDSYRRNLIAMPHNYFASIANRTYNPWDTYADLVDAYCNLVGSRR
jgi:hypothetical protein